MQRYLGILVAFLLVLPAQAAISATQVWEVEGGVGNDNFGGGFDSGVASPDHEDIEPTVF